MLSTFSCPMASSCLTWAALSQPQSCFGCSTRDDVSSLWLRGATAPCFSFLDCSVMSWRPIYPGQLEPTTLPLRRLAPVSCSVGLSPTLSLPISLALSCSISPVAPLCSFPTVLYPLSLSFSLSLSRAQKKERGVRVVRCISIPPGVRTILHGTEEVWCVHGRIVETIEPQGHAQSRGIGVFAAEDDQGPEVRFCGYVPTHHRQTNNGAELWAAVEALQGFWVPKLAILTDSQYLQLGATGRAQHWKSKGWTTTSGKLQVHVPVWEKLLQEMATPGREVRWEHVPAHVNVQGNEVANGLAMEGMCSSPLWSQHVAPNSSSGSESTVGLRGGSGSESEGTRALWSSLGMVPMDSDELTGEASGEPAPHEMGPYSSSSTESEEMRTGHTHQGVLSSALSAADTLSFSTDVSDTRRQRKKRRLRKRRNPGQGR